MSLNYLAPFCFMLAVFAEFETNLRKERPAEGIAKRPQAPSMMPMNPPGRSLTFGDNAMNASSINVTSRCSRSSPLVVAREAEKLTLPIKRQWVWLLARNQGQARVRHPALDMAERPRR